MADDRLRYALSEDQSAQIFRVLIRPEYLPDDLGAAQSPTAVLLGGQPGAGKSKLLHEASTELATNGPTVRINGDDLRDFHPRYTELQKRDPLNAARYTDADSGRWVEKLIEAAAERNVNLVIEGTMRRPEVVERTAALLREAGYRVEARAMAVPPEVSWQGVHQRFEATMAAGEAPRFSARQTHAAAVSGAVETLRQAEAGKLVDRIEVSNRAGSKLYENELKAGAWEQREKTAAETVRAEHQRGFSADELGAFEARWTALVSQMKERAALADDVDRVSREAAADIAAVRARSVEQANHPASQPQPSRGASRAVASCCRSEPRTDRRSARRPARPRRGEALSPV